MILHSKYPITFLISNTLASTRVKNAWFLTNSLSDAIDRLNADIEIMLACIPIKNGPEVKQFTKHIRENVGTFSMKAVSYGDLEYDLKSVYGDALPLLKVRQNSKDLNQEIVPINNLGLTDRAGHSIDLNFPEDNFMVIESFSTQIDSKKLIKPTLHQDEDMLTINFYAAGKGITYRIETPNGCVDTTFQSPCITIHRGKAHHFGQEGAVWHKGHRNNGQQAANILWDIRHRPVVMLMLG